MGAAATCAGDILHFTNLSLLVAGKDLLNKSRSTFRPQQQTTMARFHMEIAISYLQGSTRLGEISRS